MRSAGVPGSAFPHQRVTRFRYGGQKPNLISVGHIPGRWKKVRSWRNERRTHLLLEVAQAHDDIEQCRPCAHVRWNGDLVLMQKLSHHPPAGDEGAGVPDAKREGVEQAVCV